jgi:hypothetical protein
VRSATAMTFVPLPRLVVPTPRPLLGHHAGAVDGALGQIEPAPLVRILRQGEEELVEDPRAYPELEAAMTSLIGWIPMGQILPWGAGA